MSKTNEATPKTAAEIEAAIAHMERDIPLVDEMAEMSGEAGAAVELIAALMRSSLDTLLWTQGKAEGGALAQALKVQPMDKG